MISPNDLLKTFLDNDINFFTGVPDSILKNLTTLFNNKRLNHIVAVNEGSAVAIAIGSYLRTHKVPVVYMQNSGLGNAINPLVSIADNNVYDIPLIILIGWRGAPDIDDELQHYKMGEITEDQMKKRLGIRESITEAGEDVNKAVIPGDVKMKLQRVLDILDGKKLTYPQKLQVMGRVLDSLGIDKKELNKVTTKLRTKLESVEKKKS